MKIYDCFVFFNELELLKVRLETYYDYVDYFVLCECSKTLRGDDKPFYFEENKVMFEKYSDKIIHIKADNPPIIKSSSDWAIEFYQREQIAQGLKNAQAEDLIVISDLDEFYSPEILIAIRQNKKMPMSLNLFSEGKKKMPFRALKMFKNKMPFKMTGGGYKALKVSPLSVQQDFFYYFMNYRWNNFWHGSVFCLYKNFSNAQDLRNKRNKLPYIKRRKNPIGWHFSYLGGKEQIKLKLKSIIEGDKASIVGNIDEFIENRIREGKSLYDWQNKDSHNFLKLIALEEIGFPNIEKIAKEHREWFYFDGDEK